MLKPDAIIATWISDDSKRGIMLLANGDLSEVTRDGIAHMWSPPNVFAALQRSNSIDSLVTLLDALVTDAPVEVSSIVTSDDEVIGTTRRYLDGRETVEYHDEASTPDLLDPEGSGYVAEPPWDDEVRPDGPDRGDFGGLIGQQPY